MIYPPCYTNFS